MDANHLLLHSLLYYFYSRTLCKCIATFLLHIADFFLSVSLGIGRTDTPQVTQRKSMSTERTFSPTGDESSLYKKLGNSKQKLNFSYLFSELITLFECLMHENL